MRESEYTLAAHEATTRSPHLYRAALRVTPLLAALMLTPVLWALAGLSVQQLLDHASFVAVGIGGAIFANSTGAGGGVVFIPLFSKLGFTDAQAVATSFGIQCFGMTTGAIAWTAYYLRNRRGERRFWSGFIPAIALSTPASLAGLWAVQYWRIPAPAGTVTVFAVFSLVLGLAILTLRGQRDILVHRALERSDALALVPVAIAGGAVTAWLSVGVGEFVGFYLILRRYDVTQSIAVAVVLSALTVWGAAPHELLIGADAQWLVILVAGPGAMLGAILARRLAIYLGGLRLKRFFGAWLLVIGISELISLT
jgi:uncharacterized membrane protein YfcA